MSQKKSDLPKTGTSDSGRNRPAQGELFVRRASGAVLLTQTLKLFGRKKGS